MNKEVCVVDVESMVGIAARQKASEVTGTEILYCPLGQPKGHLASDGFQLRSDLSDLKGSLCCSVKIRPDWTQ